VAAEYLQLAGRNFGPGFGSGIVDDFLQVGDAAAFL
jgi:hypothetical protein